MCQKLNVKAGDYVLHVTSGWVKIKSVSQDGDYPILIEGTPDLIFRTFTNVGKVVESDKLPTIYEKGNVPSWIEMQFGPFPKTPQNLEYEAWVVFFDGGGSHHFPSEQLAMAFTECYSDMKSTIKHIKQCFQHTFE